MLRLHRDAKILVCDGKSALFLNNNGTPGHEAFEVAGSTHQDLPAHNADMGTDKPGRAGQNLSGPRHSIEGPDWHSEKERKFVVSAVRDFKTLCDLSPKSEIVIVAPPRALATIRESADAGLLTRCVAQIDKDLTRHPVAEMQKIILA